MKKAETQKQTDLNGLIKYAGAEQKINSRFLPESFELEHFCHVTDETNKVVFLFSTSDITRAKQFIKKNGLNIRQLKP
jgi:hypothetical protein